LKKCGRCGAEIHNGQAVCPHCGKPQRQPRRVRCRHCGTVSSGGFRVCPVCGEALKQDWIRPALMIGGLAVVVALVLFAGPSLLRGLAELQPSRAISRVQAMASEMPVLVEVPSLTPSLTPSITPTPTPVPTSTPSPAPTLTPSLTPTPTETPSPTPTETPSPTPTRTRIPPTATTPATLTPTPSPVPTLPPPTPLEPEDEAPFAESDIFRLAWRSSHTLKPDECYLVMVRYTHDGGQINLPVCVQETYWWVDRALYLQADQETQRVYFWNVRLARKETDADGNQTFLPLSPASDEWSFYWR
jgi:RNA polymerase subunit RPABC4/transcription elongation factor Spt4